MANVSPEGQPLVFEIEHASNIFQKGDQFGYTSTYSDGERTVLTPRPEHGIPEGGKFVGVNHNHTNSASDPSEFSREPNDKGGSDIIWSNTKEKSIALVAVDPTSKELVMKKHTPIPGSKQRSRSSLVDRKTIGTKTIYNPKTGKYGPIPKPVPNPAPTGATSVGMVGTEIKWKHPDGRVELRPKNMPNPFTVKPPPPAKPEPNSAREQSKK